MGFTCGIVGLPNVGKSTIFNALTGGHAEAANYAFCTITPNKEIIPVPDPRLTRLGELLNKKNPIPTRIRFTDVAGLVEGAHKGEGKGNQFLDDIRNVDAMIHVVRCFKNKDIVHVMETLDPVRDIEIINAELILADMGIVQSARERALNAAKAGAKEPKKRAELLEKMLNHLDQEKMLSSMEITLEMEPLIKELGIITWKPMLYVANADEETDPGDLEKVERYAAENNAAFLSLSGKIEEEISQLPREERDEFLEAMGLEESGLDRLIRVSYSLLDLVTFYTNATDLQAWTVKAGTTAPRGAGKIHTDFEKGFIRGEVISYEHLLETGSEQAARSKGLLRSEGKEYVIKDGDVIKFLFNL